MLKKIATLLTILAIFLSNVFTVFALSDWTQVGGDGLGDSNNKGMLSSAIYNNKLVVGIVNYVTDIKVLEYDGTSWTATDVTTGGLDSGEDYEMHSMAVYNGNLYGGIVDDGGFGRVWKYNGTLWTMANEDNFDASERGVPSMVVYNNNLYAGTVSDEDDRANIYRYNSGTSWTQVNTNGFGDGSNSGVYAMVVYNGNLYAGTKNGSTGSEIWKYDGTSWTQVNTDGFGDSNSIITYSMAVYAGNLYAGVYNDVSGTEIWKYDGTSWTQANTDGFDGDTTNTGTYALTVYNGNLYAGTSQWGGVGAEVWKYDGTSWTQINTDGFGDTNNTRIETMSVFEKKLYVGTYNNSTGGEIWSIYDEADLSLTMAVDNASTLTGRTISYTLILTNNGPDSATGIQVTDTLSSDTAYTYSSLGQGTYNGDTGVWTVGTLANGSSASITIDAVVTTATEGTVLTNSAEVTASDQYDSDSTPNNDTSSEDDQASATSTVAQASTGGISSSYYSGGGGGSSTTVSTLSGEESEAEEPAEGEVDEEDESEEPVAEEEALSEEIIEEDAPSEERTEAEEDEKNILEEATETIKTTITETITEPAPTPPPAPTYQPPAYQPAPTYQPPTYQPPAPQPTEVERFEPQEIASAIEEYEEKTATAGESAPIRKPIKEVIKENEGKESIDSDGDGISDLFQLSRGLPLGDDNPDNDDYTNSTEFYCDLDPLEADLLEDTPKIPTLREGVITGDNIAIRICSGTVGDTVDVILVNKANLTSQIYVGQTEIDEGNKGIILLQKPLEDGEYYLLVKGEKGMGEATSFEVDKSLAPKAPEVISAAEELGKIVRLVIVFNGEVLNVDAEKYIMAKTGNKIQGSSALGMIVYATWQSRILSSVLISDASQGKFELEMPSDLPLGEHEIIVYVMDEENNLISNITRFIFTR